MIRKLIVGLALSAFFLWWALRDADLGQIWEAVVAADYIWMIPMVFFTLLSFLLRSLRWKILLQRMGPVPVWPLLSATFIGFMGNNVLPARLGEIMRVYAIRSSTGMSRSAALGSLVVERILDLVMLLVFFLVVDLAGGMPEEVQSWGRYLAFALVPVLLGVVVFRIRPQPFYAILRKLAPSRLEGRLMQIAENFYEGLGSLQSTSQIVGGLILSVPMWLCLVVVVICGFHSLDISLPPKAGVITLVIMAIGTMVPSGPGFIGPLQYAGKLALTQFGIDPSLALSFTLIYHASQWFPVTIVGLFFFLGQHMSFRQITDLETGGPAADTER